ncbi:hypothetical protein LX36DRAFT_296500 [Colletotrichum falcatum]|nr:hypothetical protein LX36DRAFT_296500 [Colletotrichum falcatum]
MLPGLVVGASSWAEPATDSRSSLTKPPRRRLVFRGNAHFGQRRGMLAYQQAATSIGSLDDGMAVVWMVVWLHLYVMGRMRCWPGRHCVILGVPLASRQSSRDAAHLLPIFVQQPSPSFRRLLSPGRYHKYRVLCRRKNDGGCKKQRSQLLHV